MNARVDTSRLAAFRRPRSHGHPRSRNERLLAVRAAYTALAWVVVFFAFHVSTGTPADPSGVPARCRIPPRIRWAAGSFEVLVVSAFPLGAWVCLAIARGWPRGKMRRAAAIVVWLGCALLAVRGAAGLIDDLTRAVGFLPNGITGLSLKDTMGTAHPSASALWSSNATDAYFLAGGLVFGLLASHYRPTDQRRDKECRHGPAGRARPGAARTNAQTPAAR